MSWKRSHKPWRSGGQTSVVLRSKPNRLERPSVTIMFGWRGGQALGKSLDPVGTVQLGILPLATISETPLAVRERESVTDLTMPQGYVPPSIQPRLVGPNVKQGRLDRMAGPTP